MGPAYAARVRFISTGAVRSCITPLANVGQRKVTTIEGLSDGRGRLHPVQRAFVKHQAPQCGWCMSGQIMTAAALLAKNPVPGPEGIRKALGRNLCRCGMYNRILAAVGDAARGQV